ncbi:1-phosphofructokinase family hexose kinase [Arcticibacter tournemirensis]|uniref:1-phosphofructokinase family hexose kinase n=1 Tax=Arcticibacter tournemirensis TaxID=699437 RepID=A0A4V1KJ12_9SPHI|nr:1-phosphofructokinase family hexose kinase [Arcticibacter tournemirensis]RXF72582.1 1-phosphofructokinase family hexose kinase [Arcticibacter tournemirensis]
MIKNILTITLNPTVDKSSAVDKITPERKLRCDPPKYEPGGGGVNVSRALSRLGIQSDAFFPSGGRTGKLLEELLEKEKVSILPFELEDETRESFIVVETSTNQQYRFGMPGSAIPEEAQERIFTSIMNLSPFPDLVVISGSLPPDMEASFLRRLIKSLKEKQAKVVLDTSGEALEEAVAEGVFLLKPNIGELAKLTGAESLDNESADEAAKELITMGKAEVVVVSMGPQGAHLVTKDMNRHIPAPSVRKLSTVGAGDSMVAGMVSVLAKGGDFCEMAMMGVACGTAATMNPGTGLFKVEDVDRLYKWLQKSTVG